MYDSEVKQLHEEQPESHHGPLLSQEPQKSCNFESYQKILGTWSQEATIQSKCQRSFTEGIDYDSPKPGQEFQYSLRDILPNKQVVEVTVHIGKFTVLLLILNQQGPCLFNDISNVSNQQTETTLYHMQGVSEDLVLKKINFTENKKNSDVISMAIKECAILKICSELQCGPKARRELGFDLVMFDDGIVFSMEAGQPLQGLTNENYACLQKNLVLMHRYNLVHCDIKPENMIYSPAFDKAVFIDFGLSSIIKEQVGSLTLVDGFKGNTKHCSAQMFGLFVSGCHQKWLDLYYNDAFCLQSSYQTFQVQETRRILKSQDHWENQYMQQTHTDQLPVYCFYFMAKYYCVQVKQKQFIQLANQGKRLLMKSMGRKLLRFIKTLIPFLAIQRIFLQEFSSLNKIQEYQQIIDKINYRSYKMPLISSQSLKLACDYAARFNYEQILPQNSLDDNPVLTYLKDTKNYRACKERYLTALIRMLRLDLKNTELSNKVQLCIMFKKQVGIGNKSKLVSNLAHFQHVVSYIIDECLRRMLDPLWIADNIFILFQFGALLELDFTSQWNKFYHSLIVELFVETHRFEYLYLSMTILGSILNSKIKMRKDPQLLIKIETTLLSSPLINQVTNHQQSWEKPYFNQMTINALKNNNNIQDTMSIVPQLRSWLQELKPFNNNKYQSKDHEFIYYTVLNGLVIQQYFQQSIEFFKEYCSVYETKESPQMLFVWVLKSNLINALGGDYQVKSLFKQFSQILDSQLFEGIQNRQYQQLRLQNINNLTYQQAKQGLDQFVQDIRHEIKIWTLRQKGFPPIEALHDILSNYEFIQTQFSTLSCNLEFFIELYPNLLQMQEHLTLKVQNMSMLEWITLLYKLLMIKFTIVKICPQLKSQVVSDWKLNPFSYYHNDFMPQPLNWVVLMNQVSISLNQCLYNQLTATDEIVYVSTFKLYKIALSSPLLTQLMTNCLLWMKKLVQMGCGETLFSQALIMLVQHCEKSSLFHIYLQHKQLRNFLYYTLKLYSNFQVPFSVIYKLLGNLAKQVSKTCFKSQVLVLINQINQLSFDHPPMFRSIFNLTNIIQLVPEIRWQNRFALIYMCQALYAQSLEENRLLLRKLIVKSINLLPIFARQMLLDYYYPICLKQQWPQRKVIHIACRQAFNYVNRDSIKVILKPIRTNLRKKHRETRSSVPKSILNCFIRYCR